MQHFKLPVFTLFVFLSINSFAQQTKIDVQKGQKYKVETTTKLTTAAEVMGQVMENNSDTKSTTMYEVLNVGPEEIKLASIMTKILMTASMMGQETSFDSDKKNNEGPIADMLSKMVNKSKDIKLDNKGNITKQDVSDDGDALSSLTGAGGGSNQTVSDLFVPALMGKELKPGESFADIVTVKKEKFDSRDSGTYKITAIENGVVSISYTGTQVLSIVMEQMGMEMTMNSNNVVKTELQMDIKTGLVLAKATVIESTANIDAGGMTIPSTGKTIITINVSPAM